MKAFTFVSMLLLAISGATAQSVTVEAADTATATFPAAQTDLTTERICMRCRNGG